MRWIAFWKCLFLSIDCKMNLPWVLHTLISTGWHCKSWPWCGSKLAIMLSSNCYFCSLMYSVSFSLNSTLKSQKESEEIDNLEKAHKIKRLECFQMENFLSDISYSLSKFRHASNSQFSEPSCKNCWSLIHSYNCWASRWMLKYSYESSLQFEGNRAIRESFSEWNLHHFNNPISSTFQWRGLQIVEEDAIHTSDFFHFPQPHSPETQIHGFGRMGNRPCSLSQWFNFFVTMFLNSCSFNNYIFWKMIKNVVINPFGLSPVTVKTVHT